MRAIVASYHGQTHDHWTNEQLRRNTNTHHETRLRMGSDDALTISPGARPFTFARDSKNIEALGHLFELFERSVVGAFGKTEPSSRRRSLFVIVHPALNEMRPVVVWITERSWRNSFGFHLVQNNSPERGRRETGRKNVQRSINDGRVYCLTMSAETEFAISSRLPPSTGCLAWKLKLCVSENEL